jgi:hypothetical protein
MGLQHLVKRFINNEQGPEIGISGPLRNNPAASLIPFHLRKFQIG